MEQCFAVFQETVSPTLDLSTAQPPTDTSPIPFASHPTPIPPDLAGTSLKNYVSRKTEINARFFELSRICIDHQTITARETLKQIAQ